MLAGGPSEPGLEYIFLFAAALVAGASLVAWRLPTGGSVSVRAARGDYRILLRHGPFLRVLAFVFGMFFFIHGPMVIFPIFIRSLGGTMESVSYMWIWMIALEIPLVTYTSKFFKAMGPRLMLAIAALAVSGVTASAETITVCAGGCDYTSINAAIGAASDVSHEIDVNLVDMATCRAALRGAIEQQGVDL